MEFLNYENAKHIAVTNIMQQRSLITDRQELINRKISTHEVKIWLLMNGYSQVQKQIKGVRKWYYTKNDEVVR